MTAVPSVEPQKAPINQFTHILEFPDDTYRDVVSPNVDTLYSLAWLDLAAEPIVLRVPDLADRYYLMQICDAWTNVFSAPGTRTTGNRPGAFALVGPEWRGTLPPDVQEIAAPTNLVWIIGRTYTAGKADYATVNAIQRQYELVPLAAWGRPYTPPARVPVAPGVDAKTPPVVQVGKEMSAGVFLDRLAQLMGRNPPAPEDEPMISRLRRIGVRSNTTPMGLWTSTCRKTTPDPTSARTGFPRHQTDSAWSCASTPPRRPCSTGAGARRRSSAPDGPSHAACNDIESPFCPTATAVSDGWF